MSAIKHALDLDGRPHDTVSHIEEGNAGGWRRVYFKNGTVAVSVSSLP